MNTLAPTHWKEFHSLGRCVNLGDGPFRVRYWKTVDRLRAGHIGQEQQAILQTFEAQNRVVQEALDGVSPRNAESAAIAALENDSGRLEGALRNLYGRVGTAFAVRTAQSLRGKHFVWPIDRKRLSAKQDFQEDEFRAAMMEYVDGPIGELIQITDDTTKERVRSIVRSTVREATEEGIGAEATARRIQERVNDTIVDRTRARRIARTEVLRASNFGSITAARDSPLPLKKEWIETQDSRTRPSHTSSGVGGDIVALEENFIVGGFAADYPNDPALPASESINCRCTLAYVIDEDQEQDPVDLLPDGVVSDPASPGEFIRQSDIAVPDDPEDFSDEILDANDGAGFDIVPQSVEEYISSLNEYTDNIPTQRRRVLERYAQRAYKQMNKSLRGQDVSADDVENILAGMPGFDNLDDAIETLTGIIRNAPDLDDPVTTYRAGRLDDAMEKLDIDDVDNLKNEVIQDPAFQSTSYSIDKAEDFVDVDSDEPVIFEIINPTDVDAVNVAESQVDTYGEFELLLQRGSKFLVQEIETREIERGVGFATKERKVVTVINLGNDP